MSVNLQCAMRPVCTLLLYLSFEICLSNPFGKGTTPIKTKEEFQRVLIATKRFPLIVIVEFAFLSDRNLHC